MFVTYFDVCVEKRNVETVLFFGKFVFIVIVIDFKRVRMLKK